MNKNFRNTGTLSAILSSLILFSGCGVFVRNNAGEVEKLLTINRLWRMHEDVNYVYFYYDDGTVESGLILRWDGDKVKIQKKEENTPVYIPTGGIRTIKVVTGNRIWEFLAGGSALAAGYFFLSGAGDVGGESSGAVAVKMFGAPLIIMASVVIGASYEKTETYTIPENFEFYFDEIKRIHDITD